MLILRIVRTVVSKLLDTELLGLANCFDGSFRSWGGNVVINGSLSTAWTHRSSRVLIIHTKIMIEFCVWFKNALGSLIYFVWVFSSFDHLNLVLILIDNVGMTTSVATINVAVINDTASVSSVVSWGASCGMVTRSFFSKILSVSTPYRS